MKNHLFKLLYFILLTFLFLACSEDDIASNNNNTSENNSVIEMFSDNFGESVQANFFGRVLDIENNAIEGVNVQISGMSTFTDQNGVFAINNTNVYENFAFVKASKDGFLKGSKTLVPLTNEENYIEIVLLQNTTTATVNSGETSEVSLNNESRVTLNGNYIRGNGSNYSGAVEVSMHNLKPSNNETFRIMPGSLYGSLENNQAVTLETFGMISVNLFSPDGEPLDLAEGATATLELPIDSSQIAFAPQSIPLWYFDDDLGYWIKEGEAQKIGNKYVGEVSHFTWWTYCIYDDGVNTCINVKNTNGDEIPYHYFTISKQENGAIIRERLTSANGNFCDFLPYNEPLIFSTIFTNCDGSETLYEQEIGPFITNNTEVDITLNIIDFVSSSVTASILDCDSETPIENGYFFFEYNGEAYNYPINGSVFEFNFLFCVEQPQITLIAYNLDTNTETETIDISLNSGLTDLGTLNACGSSGSGNEDDNVFQGDVTLGTQQEVNDFGAMAYTKITGNLVIDDAFPETIMNLNALQNLIVIEGNLEIKFNGELTNLFGLQNLERVEGTLLIQQNFNINSVNGLQSLNTIGGDFTFYNNDACSDLNGLQNISIIPGHVDIASNDSLLSLEGLNNLTEIGGSFSLGSSSNFGSLSAENSQLNDISALSNLTIVNNEIRLVGQPILEDYSGLNSLQSVNGDFTIVFEGENPYEINSFQALSSVNGRLIIENIYATDISGFNNLLTVEEILISGLSSSNGLLNLSGFNGCNNSAIRISNHNNLLSITGFQNLQTSNRINISQNNSLQSITGFNTLQNDTITLQVSSNSMLSDISGFANVNSVNTLLLNGCPLLSNLSAFSNLTEINGYAIISWMNGLSDLSGLESLTIVEGRLEIYDNENITSLNGLNNLTTINFFLDINNNDNLINLNGLENLTYIDDYLSIYSNQNLESLEGVENLLNSDGLRIGVYYNISSFVDRPNPSLSNFCALQNLLVNGDTSGSNEIIIDNNAYNPTVIDIQNGNCSL